MIINPILPVWLVLLICLGLIAIRIKDKWGLVIQIGICILIFVINLRPMLTKGTIITEETNLDVIFVVDNTISMLAEDYNGNNTRFTGVAEDCKTISEALGGSRYSVITFNNYSRILVPFTTDVKMVYNAVDGLSALNEYDARGSSLNTPKDDLEEMLKRSRESNETRRTIVIFMSDGEITSKESLKSYKSLAANVDGGMVLGYGTEKGAVMRYQDDYSGEYYTVYDYSTYGDAISKIDEKNLKSIASDLGIDYLHRNGEGNLASRAEEISATAEYKGTSSKAGGTTDIYFVFLIPLMLLLAVEWFTFERKKVVL